MSVITEGVVTVGVVTFGVIGGGGSANRNIYLYGVDNTSSLQLGESLTGDFKGWIAGTSSTGVNPDLLALVVGTWQDTIDLADPVWNQINGAVTGLTYIVASGFVGYVPSYAKDNVWSVVDSGAIAGSWLEQFVVLGASISDGVVSGKTTLMSLMFANNGIDGVTVKDESTGGRHVDEIEAHWDTVKATYTGQAGTACYSHCLGNDTSSLQPYSSTTQLQRDDLAADVVSLVNNVETNGNVSILAEITFRGYDSSSGQDYTWHNEDNGSLPFNENILFPVIQSNNAAQWFNGAPRQQNYNWSFNYGNLLLEIAENRIHFNAEGSELLRRLWVDNVSNWAKELPPITFDKMTAATALSYARLPAEVILMESSTTSTGPSGTVPFANFWQITASNTGSRLVPIRGYVPCSMSVTSTASVLAHGTNTFPNDGSTLATLENYKIKNAYGFTSSAVFVEMQKISGLNANQACSVGVASYRNSTSNNRAQFRINGDDGNLLSTNAANYSDQNVAWGEFIADSSGEITIEIRKSSGDQAYWNGTHIIPL